MPFVGTNLERPWIVPRNDLEFFARDFFMSLLQKLGRWFRAMQLQRELRRSELFQKRYEKMRCFHLARMEQEYRETAQKKIGLEMTNGGK